MEDRQVVVCPRGNGKNGHAGFVAFAPSVAIPILEPSHP